MNIDNLVYDRPDLGKFQVHRSSMTSPRHLRTGATAYL